MERKGAEYGCWAPPNTGCLWYIQLIELLDHWMANKIIELLKYITQSILVFA